MDSKQLKSMGFGNNPQIQTDPLELRKILLSAAAQLNMVGRFISQNFAEVEQYGGFHAASDCFCSADVLMEVIKQCPDNILETVVALPPGIGYAPFPKQGGNGQ